ncbi:MULTISPECIES: DUF6542 domain-containing protein [unclassified Actinopolyspora]|uniref:DUF6542 domain-containing protein n=1 Tax=unclassified Actinopolyspora TaxID=2639451 RepID=UPI0013F656AC|nr:MULTISPECIES: DUF6542 domain-containing protein [unclassified Actinopolyspora]NHD17877.1 hypothetical protein [Actinopolyspora sp. BKK2]NHE77750.1 hypothetical protein [Actinopolyspora sp. BKK1]
MTATSERKIHTAEGPSNQWAERSAFGNTRSISWWAACLLPLVLTSVCIVIDLLVQSKPGFVFVAGYIVSSLLAVALVRRGSLFGPMVQPPLVIAVTIPTLVLVTGTGFNSGDSGRNVMLSVVTPLINSFPAMATATVLVLLAGLLRIHVLERSNKDGTASRTSKSQSARSESAGAPKTRGRRSPRPDEDQRDEVDAERTTRKTGAPSQRRERGKQGEPTEKRSGSANKQSSRSGREPAGDASREGAGDQRRSARPGRGARQGQRPAEGERNRSGASGEGGRRGERPQQQPGAGKNAPPPNPARGGEGKPPPGREKRSAPPGRAAPGQPSRDGGGGAAKPPQRGGRAEPPGRPRRPRRDEG